MKKVFLLVSLALVLGLVLIGCPQPNDGGNGGGTPEPVFEDYTSTTGSIGMKAITGGEFARDNDGPGSGTDTTAITVSDFYLGETEVTQGQWEAVMGDTWPNQDPDTDDQNYGDGNDYPAYYINWYDAIAFCNKLSFMEGLTLVYSVKVGGVEVDWENITGALTPDVNDTDWNAATVNFDADGYRLPTEAEWEYAAGGGESSARTIYAGTDTGTNDPLLDDLGDYAWYRENAGNTTHIVGTAGTESSTTPKSGNDNDLGLYDMSGNVWEWCWDWHVNPYDTTLTDNPTGATSGSNRVFRGGSWPNRLSGLRVADRNGTAPSFRSHGRGLRVARSVAP